MLYVLAGDIQTGKTSWLEQLVETLEHDGVPVRGVLAPGVWRSGDDPQADGKFVDANGFEKLGIDNVLYPGRERVPFARRRDIALSLGLLDPGSQSERAQLLWHIDDNAIARVNAHLAALAAHADVQPGLLVVDELGRLELEFGGGLTEAVALLESGPTRVFPHALVVVRSALVERIERCFPLWGEPLIVKAGDEAASMIARSFHETV